MSGKTILQNEEEMKTFSDEQKLREFATKPILQEMLKRVLLAETKGWWTATWSCTKINASSVKVKYMDKCVDYIIVLLL